MTTEEALANCYALARRRARRKDADPSWQHIIRFCEEAGLKGEILRTGPPANQTYMARNRKVVRAFRWTGRPAEVPPWVKKALDAYITNAAYPHAWFEGAVPLSIWTGWHEEAAQRASVGDWLVQAGHYRIDTLSNEEFHQRYEPTSLVPSGKKTPAAPKARGRVRSTPEPEPKPKRRKPMWRCRA